MDFTGFQQVIDKIGGIDVNVAKAIYDRSYPAYDNGPFSVFSNSSGEHHLDGATALKYARSRESTSDFDRAHRQQQILLAVKEKVLNLGFLSNPKNIIDLVNIVSSHVRTNFSPTEIQALATFFKGVDSSHVINKVFDDSTTGLLSDSTINGTYYLVPKTGNFNQVKDAVGNIFNENSTSSTSSTKANLEIINAAGISGVAAKLATKLEADGYTVVDTQTSKTLYQKTVIYDYSNGKYSKDIQFLEDGLDLFNTVKKTKSSGTSQSVNITIILGEDYQGFTNSLN
jgi:anionic cell wall polymer biosynthesis LytR-Cps2A-Psr (LCP) family protein